VEWNGMNGMDEMEIIIREAKGGNENSIGSQPTLNAGHLYVVEKTYL
jgi:hypothetical protein